MDATAQFYSQPTYVQAGGAAMPVFAGSRRQRGGSVLGALKSFFMPLFSRLSKRSAKAAMNVAQNVVGDVMTGKNVAAALKQHGLKAAKRFGNEALSSVMGQMTAGKTRKAPARKAPARKAPARQAPSRKRAAPSKAKQTAKRVKGNF